MKTAGQLCYATTWGPVTVTWKNGRLDACRLPVASGPHDIPQPCAPPPRGAPATLIRQLDALLGGGVRRDWPWRRMAPGGTPFQQSVWRELHRIPAGQTLTYGAIARRIGRPRAARAVGRACGANPLPLFIPCHRAVAARGPGGFSAGPRWKTFLLALEHPPATAARTRKGCD